MTLTEFLTARIAEDEAVAREVKEWFGGWGWSYFDPIVPDPLLGTAPSYTLFDKGIDQVIADVTGGKPGAAFVAYTLHHQPRRALAECEAKRAIVERHEAADLSRVAWYGDDWAGPDGLACATCGTANEYAVKWPCETLLAVALPYADHPDFDQEWKL